VETRNAREESSGELEHQENKEVRFALAHSSNPS
jgi:hypothetical protein